MPPRSLPRVEAFAAHSLDGFIARPDGDTGWLLAQTVPAGEDFGLAAFMRTMGAVVMGAATYARARRLPRWPYPVPVVVMTPQPGAGTVPPDLVGQVRITDDPPQAVLADLTGWGIDRVCLDGEGTLRRFLAERLVDRLVLTQVPVLLGQGIALFGHGPGEIGARLVRVRRWRNGFVQMVYDLDPAPARNTAPRKAGSSLQRG